MQDTTKSRKPPAKGKVTLKSIAEACDVKMATVSRVLNNKDGFSIRPEKRELIINIAKKMGYRPNTAARNLRLKKTNQLMIHGYDIFYSQAEATFTGMLSAFLREVNARGYQANMVFPASNNQLTAPLAFDGALFTGFLDHNLVDDFITNKTPFVLLNDRMPGTSWVSVDDYYGMRLALDHLYKLGHRRIAYRCSHSKHRRLKQHHSISDRHNSYVNWMAEHKLNEMTDFSTELNESQFLKQIIESNTTAVVTYDYLLAIELEMCCRKNGIRIPDDLNIITFNRLAPKVIGPSFTSIRKPLEDMGAYAADILLRLINGKISIEQKIFKLSLHEGGTTCHHPQQ